MIHKIVTVITFFYLHLMDNLIDKESGKYICIVLMLRDVEIDKHATIISSS